MLICERLLCPQLARTIPAHPRACTLNAFIVTITPHPTYLKLCICTPHVKRIRIFAF